MNDGQTSGGYPRLINVISADQHWLGQLKPGDEISFYPTTVDKAQQVYQEKQQLLKKLIPN